jgi:hypothetical protein
MFRVRDASSLPQAVALALAAVASSCVNPLTALPKLFEARRLSTELHVSFTRAADASNRAVMADTDEASIAAKDEAVKARQVVDRDLEALQPILHDLGYIDEQRDLGLFRARYEEYRRLDDEILPLAVENSNLKAQKLSFGAAQDAAAEFRASLDDAVRLAPPAQANAAALAAERARSSVLEIQVLQAPHIAASDDAAMTRMEGAMKESAASAKAALDRLKAMLPRAAAPLAAADSALAHFLDINTQIVALSRKNTNVRSLALSMGRKRAVTAECEDQLVALGEALAKHESTATR